MNSGTTRRLNLFYFDHLVQSCIYKYQFCCIFAEIHFYSWHVLQKVVLQCTVLYILRNIFNWSNEINCNCRNISTFHSFTRPLLVVTLQSFLTFTQSIYFSFRFRYEKWSHGFLQKGKHVYFKSFENVQLRILKHYNKSMMVLGMLCGASHPHLTEAGQQLPGVSES